MYLLIFILTLLLFFLLFNHFRRNKIIKKICSMCMSEKCALMTVEQTLLGALPVFSGRYSHMSGKKF